MQGSCAASGSLTPRRFEERLQLGTSVMSSTPHSQNCGKVQRGTCTQLDNGQPTSSNNNRLLGFMSRLMLQLHRDSREVKMARTIVFVHVPKTAGTSLASSLTKIIGSQYSAALYEGLPASFGGLRFVHTHNSFNEIEQVDGDKAYFTCVRRPIDRLVSTYRYFSSITSRHATENRLEYVMKAKKQTFCQFVLDRSERIDNEVVRQFSGKKDRFEVLSLTDLQTAVQNLQKCIGIFTKINVRSEFVAATNTHIDELNVTDLNHEKNQDAFEGAPTVDLCRLSKKALYEMQRLTAMDQIFYDIAVRRGAELGFGEFRKSINDLN